MWDHAAPMHMFSSDEPWNSLRSNYLELSTHSFGPLWGIGCPSGEVDGLSQSAGTNDTCWQTPTHPNELATPPFPSEMTVYSPSTLYSPSDAGTSDLPLNSYTGLHQDYGSLDIASLSGVPVQV